MELERNGFSLFFSLACLCHCDCKVRQAGLGGSRNKTSMEQRVLRRKNTLCQENNRHGEDRQKKLTLTRSSIACTSSSFPPKQAGSSVSSAWQSIFLGRIWDVSSRVFPGLLQIHGSFPRSRPFPIGSFDTCLVLKAHCWENSMSILQTSKYTM